MARKEQPTEIFSREEIIKSLFGLENITEIPSIKKRKTSFNDIRLL